MNQRTIDRQEKFAEDNYAGLEDAAESLLSKLDTIKEMWDRVSKLKKENTKAEWEEAYKEAKDFSSSLDITMSIIGIKLSNTVGHALNARSTKMIKKVIKFLDKYSLNDNLIHDGLMRIASKRNARGDILDMALIVAAKHDDLAFAKYIMKFAEKNKKRKNIFDIGTVSHDVYRNGNMQSMTKIYKKERIAFEALINGSKRVYNFITDNKGLSHDYIMQYVTSKYFSSRLTKEEVGNVLTIHPDMINDILEYMPENVPDDLKDIFLF